MEDTTLKAKRDPAEPIAMAGSDYVAPELIRLGSVAMQTQGVNQLGADALGGSIA